MSSYEDVGKKQSKMIYPFQNSFADTFLWCYCRKKKKVCIKSQAFPVEGVQFLRKMGGTYLFCFLLSPEDGKLWGGCRFGGSWGCRSDGRAQRVHCWASNLSWEGLSQESPRGWQWNAIAEQREALPHLGLPSSPPQARPPDRKSVV